MLVCVSSRGSSKFTPVSVASDQLMARSNLGFVGIEMVEEVDFQVPAGSGGAAAIYTGKADAIAVIRRIMIRMYSWMNYL